MIFFDYGDNNVGKPTGIDIMESKMTLPLIYALNQATPSEKRAMIKTMKRSNKKKKEVKEVIQFVLNKKGLEYARDRMHEHRDLALKQLRELNSPGTTEYLESLINYVISRKK